MTVRVQLSYEQLGLAYQHKISKGGNLNLLISPAVSLEIEHALLNPSKQGICGVNEFKMKGEHFLMTK